MATPSSDLEAERAFYRHAKEEAEADSVEAHAEIGITFQVRPIDAPAVRIVETVWEPAGRKYAHWEWMRIRNKYRSRACWNFTIWHGDQLCALVAASGHDDHICAEFIEADPRDGAPLKPERAAVALDLLIRYAEACNVNELRINPLTPELAAWYQSIAPFEPFPPDGTPAYYRLQL